MDNADENLIIRPIQVADLPELWALSYGPKADLEWLKYNGPYFEDPLQDWQTYREGWGQKALDNPLRRGIQWQGELVGEVSAYWSDRDLRQWLEIGIVLYDRQCWGQKIGERALKLWLTELFNRFDYLPHIGFTTWSGNPGMMRLGDKVGMQKEGVIRQVRYWQGRYYDSVKYGLLRAEWQQWQTS